jgi:hypothetical protein
MAGFSHSGDNDPAVGVGKAVNREGEFRAKAGSEGTQAGSLGGQYVTRDIEVGAKRFCKCDGSATHDGIGPLR